MDRWTNKKKFGLASAMKNSLQACFLGLSVATLAWLSACAQPDVVRPTTPPSSATMVKTPVDPEVDGTPPPEIPVLPPAAPVEPEPTAAAPSTPAPAPEMPPASAPVNGASFKLFSDEVHPTLKQWCGSCHTPGSQPPYLASPNAEQAYNAILSTSKMDFKDPLQSRIYLRIFKENHNCPAPNCADASKVLAPKLEEWAKVAVANQDSGLPDVNQSLTTAQKAITEAVSTRKDSGVPAGSFYFPAETGTLKAPFILKDNTSAEGGKSVTTAAGAVNQLNLAAAEADQTLGTVIFNVKIVTSGNYHVVGRVSSPNANQANNSSFYIRTDANPLQVWDYPATNNALVYNKAAAAAVAPAVGPPLVFNLTAGDHTIEIRQRQPGVELDSLILTPNLTYDFSLFATAERSFATLEFDLSKVSGVAGATISIDVGDFDSKSYLIRNPNLKVPQGSLKIKGLKILINDKFRDQHATFLSVNDTVASPGKILSTASMIALKGDTPASDKFSLSFEMLEKLP